MTEVLSERHDDDAVIDEPPIARLKHPTAIRWMHWINFPLLTIMIWSGMRIYWADLRDPYVVAGFEFWPDIINEKLGLERRLARGMAFHFTFGWLFTINGIAYGLYLWRSGEWRQLVPERSTLADSVRVVLHDIGIGRGKPLPPQARYNGAQRLTYSLVIAMGAVVVLSGLAIYKPTQLSPLTTALGGYERARTIHFATTIGFLAFFAVHLLQVARAGWGNFMSMVTGYQLDRGRGSGTKGADHG
jgi:thiosulfate reductase cytochrome b subunit